MITMKKRAGGVGVPVPPVDRLAVFVDENNALAAKDSSGAIFTTKGRDAVALRASVSNVTAGASATNVLDLNFQYPQLTSTCRVRGEFFARFTQSASGASSFWEVLVANGVILSVGFNTTADSRTNCPVKFELEGWFNASNGMFYVQAYEWRPYLQSALSQQSIGSANLGAVVQAQGNNSLQLRVRHRTAASGHSMLVDRGFIELLN